MSAAFAATALACGGGSDDSGVSSAKKLGELDGDEQGALCDEYEEVVRSNADTVTEVSCTLASQGESDCASARAQCIRQTGEDGGPGGLDVEQAVEGCRSGVTASCPDVTVGEARACFEALSASMKALAASVSCDSVSVPEPSRPEACASLGDRCPELASLGG